MVLKDFKMGQKWPFFWPILATFFKKIPKKSRKKTWFLQFSRLKTTKSVWKKVIFRPKNDPKWVKKGSFLAKKGSILDPLFSILVVILIGFCKKVGFFMKNHVFGHFLVIFSKKIVIFHQKFPILALNTNNFHFCPNRKNSVQIRPSKMSGKKSGKMTKNVQKWSKKGSKRGHFWGHVWKKGVKNRSFLSHCFLKCTKVLRHFTNRKKVV